MEARKTGVSLEWVDLSRLKGEYSIGFWGLDLES
jgi:hypothetical protein